MLGYEREDVELSVRRLRVLIASRVIGRKRRLPSEATSSSESTATAHSSASASTQKSRPTRQDYTPGTLQGRLLHAYSISNRRRSYVCSTAAIKGPLFWLSQLRPE